MRSILIVDDDQRLLKSFERLLGSRFSVKTANGAETALAFLEEGPHPGVIISDYRMPGMDGVDFLARAGQVAPDAVRILLTGHADLDVATRAVNEGNIFRLLTKPCPPKVMAKALVDAFRYHDLVVGEREFMERTVQESVAVLGDMMALVEPDVYGRISRIVPYVRRISRRMAPDMLWEIVTAARLSMIGFVTLPENLVRKVLDGRQLTDKERGLFEQHPEFGGKFIGKIPRMEGVAEIIARQESAFPGLENKSEGGEDSGPSLGARILKVCLDLDTLLTRGLAKGDALTEMYKMGIYDEAVLNCLTQIMGDEARYCVREYYLHGLTPGMILADEVVAARGSKTIRILAKGQELSEMMIEYLLKYSKHYTIREPVKVLQALSCKL